MYVLGLGLAATSFSQQPSLPSFCPVLNIQNWQLVQASWQLAASLAALRVRAESTDTLLLKAMLL